MTPSPAFLRFLLLAVLFAPLCGAALLALTGGGARVARRLSFLHLLVAAYLVVVVAPDIPLATSAVRESAGMLFVPRAVPGDAVGPADGETGWVLASLPGPGAAEFRFYIGLDGLNLGLVLLVSVMMFVATLITDETRGDAFFSWLFVLQTMTTGAFLAFDALLFYVFFELTLIPVFFLIGSWGSGVDRMRTASRFVLYTLFGGLFTLVGLAALTMNNPVGEGRSFSIPRLAQSAMLRADAKRAAVNQARKEMALAEQRVEACDKALSLVPAGTVERTHSRAAHEVRELAAALLRRAIDDEKSYQRVQAFGFITLLIGFAVKLPLVPFHGWMPSTYSESPLPLTMILSALLSKLGAYGILRVGLPLAPDAAIEYGLPLFGVLAAVGLLYGAFCAYAEKDLKLFVAFSSLSHLGLLALGLFAGTRESLTGATLHLTNHGLATGVLFALLAYPLARYGTLNSDFFGGLYAKHPGWSWMVIVACLAGIGLPGLNNFVGEILILAGLWSRPVVDHFGSGFAIVALLGLFPAAWYTMTMLRKILFGPLREPQGEAAPLTSRERVAFLLPLALCGLLGLMPRYAVDTIRPDADAIARVLEAARQRAETQKSLDEDRRP